MAVATPCVAHCVLDEASGLCLGRGRTLAEIAAWGLLSEPERLSLMARLAERARPVAEHPQADPWPVDPDAELPEVVGKPSPSSRAKSGGS